MALPENVCRRVTRSPNCALLNEHGRSRRLPRGRDRPRSPTVAPGSRGCRGFRIRLEATRCNPKRFSARLGCSSPSRAPMFAANCLSVSCRNTLATRPEAGSASKVPSATNAGWMKSPSKTLGISFSKRSAITGAIACATTSDTCRVCSIIPGPSSERTRSGCKRHSWTAGNRSGSVMRSSTM